MRSRNETSRDIISIVSSLYGDPEDLSSYIDANGVIDFPTSVTFKVDGKTENEVYDEISKESSKMGIESSLVDLHVILVPYNDSTLIKVD